MTQQFQQPQRGKRQEDQPDDTGSIYPSFYTGPEKSRTDPEQTVNNIDDVLAQNDAVRAGIPSTDDLRTSEESGAAGPVGAKGGRQGQEELSKLGAGFRSEDAKGGTGFVRKIALSRRNKLLAGGGLGGLLLAIILSAFFALPLKVQHIANNLQQEFYATAEQATEDMTDALMRSYIVKYLVPGMVKNNCTSTRINKDCVNTSTSNNIVGVLYNGWRDGRIENNLAEKGIVIEREGGRFLLTTPSGTADLGTYDPENPDAFSQSARRELSRNEIRKQMKIALKEETHWSRVMYRYKVGGLMERKYGVQRCVIACQTRDKWADAKEEYKKKFARSIITQRVLNPLSEFSSLAMECAMGGFKCTDEGDVDANGERPSDIELQYRERLADYRNRYPDVDLADLDREAEELRSKGMIEHILSKVIGKTATKFIPIIGWVDLGAQLMAGATQVGPAAVKLTYVANSTAAVQAYMLLRTNADEIKTGKIDAEMAGSVATALSETDRVDRTDQNGVGAEGSPLYGALMGSTTTKTKTASLSATAYAASNVYGCEDNDNKPVPKGMFVCPVERLDAVTSVGTVFNKISDIANSPMMKSGAVFSKIWVNTAGKILGVLEVVLKPVINAAMSTIPGNPEEKLAALAKPIVETMMSYIVKPIIGTASSGARLFNLMATGADVSGNDFTHYGLGAGSVSYQQAHQIRVAREQERYDEFKNRSMFARMFSTDTDYSLVSKAAMATPLSSSGNVSPTFMSVLTNPVKAFTSGFAAVATAPSVSAKVGMEEDHAGVKQYAYSPTDPIFDSDPETKYDELDCDNVEVTKAWGNRAENNPNTEMLDHKPGDTNPCLLIRSAAGSAGAVYTDGVLTDEDKATYEGSGETTAATSGTTIRAGTYNVKVPGQTDGAGDPGNEWLDSSIRMPMIARVIKEQKFDVVGLQEVEPSTRGLLNAELRDSYSSWPGNDAPGLAWLHPLFWDKNRFNRTGEGYIDTSFRKCSGVQLCTKTPWVKLLEKKSGQEFYITSIHMVNANPDREPGHSDEGGAEKREAESKSIASWVQSLPEDAKAVVVGDFNSSWTFTHDDGAIRPNRNRIPYCILTSTSRLRHVYDLTNNSKDGGKDCPTTNARPRIDHIYVTSDTITAKNDKILVNDITRKASDHFPRWSDLVIGEAVGGGGWVWPVPGVKSLGILPYGAKNSEGLAHKGIDIGQSGGATLGKTVVAAHSGVVERVWGQGDACGAYISIKATGTKYYAAYQHIAGDSIKVKAGDNVQSGQPIAKVGRQGGSTCGSSGFYHVHFSIETKPGYVSGYADPFPNGTINPLELLPR